MKNLITTGSELLTDTFSIQKSTEDIIVNEDACIVVQINSYSGTGIVEGYKIWDINKTKKFYAKALYSGQEGTPEITEIEVNSYSVFYRVGDFNSQGTEGFERHTENASNTSFVCFVAKSEGSAG